MRKGLLRCIAVVMFVFMIAVCAPITEISDLFTVEASAIVTNGKVNLGSNIKWKYDSKTKTINVSGSGAMYNYANGDDGQRWDELVLGLTHYPNKHAEKLVISNGITSIGNNVFNGLKGIKSVTIPASVTSIGNSAFKGCTALTSVTIPSSVTSIGNSAFEGCSALTSVTISSGVKTIGSNAFKNTKAAKITIPDSVTSIGSGAFSGISSLKITCNYGTAAYDYCVKNSLSCTLPENILVSDVAYDTAKKTATVTLKIVYNKAKLNAGNFTFAYTNATPVDKTTVVKTVNDITTAVVYNGTGKVSISMMAPDYVPYSSNIGVCEYTLAELKFNLNCKAAASDFTFKADTLMMNDAKVSIKSASATAKLPHTSVTVKGKAATCTATGLTDGAKCSVCNTVITAQKTIAKLGHKSVTVKGKAATCTATGLTDGAKCSVCNTVITAQKTIAKIAHKSVTVKGKAATCTATGLTDGKKCSVCNATITAQKSIAKIAHTYKTTTTKATLTKSGSVKTACSMCGNVKSSSTIAYPKTFTLSSTSYTYDGNVKAPTVTVKDSAGKTLKKDTDYTVTYASGRKTVGTYNVTVTMKGNYSGTKTLTFKINPINISTCTVKLSATSYTYDGAVKAPTVTVKNAKGSTLTKGTHYTVTYASGRKAVGTYKVTVTMKGNYSGTKTLTFKINPIDISKCTVKLSATSYTYDGAVKAPTVTVKNAKGSTLTKGTHYTVTYASGRKAVGTYKVTVTMKGNYSGTKTLTFKINPINISTCTVKLDTTNYTYNGSVKTPTVTVKNAKGSTLTKGTHYTVTYASGRKSVGAYKVTVKMKGNYTGSKTLTMYVLPSKTSKITPTATTTTLKATWNKVTGASGYRVELLNANGKVLKKVTTTKLTYTFSGLSAGTTYKVRVTAYKTISGTNKYSLSSTTLTTATKPATPTLKVTSTTKGKANLSWTNVAGETGYQAYYSSKKDSGFKSVASYKTDVLKGSKSSLTSGKTYYFKVRAYKKVGDTVVYGGWSTVKSVKIK